jgi:predicted component of type VI protein secretion system
MIQLKILSGKRAGDAYVARRFPVRIGRAAASDWRLEEDGVWDQHFQVEFNPADGFILSARPEAPATVNGQACRQAVLRNGDTIEVGSLKIRFWLGETCQTSLRLREVVTWGAIAAISLGQVALIYWLLNV